MANIIIRPDWHIPERSVTPEAVSLNRRHFLRQMGFAGAGLLAAPLAGCARTENEATPATNATAALLAPSKAYPAPRNPEFNPRWTFTNEKVAGNYNNFYEFTLDKNVYRHVDRFVTAPWPIQ